jgi:hypothetical protein
MTVAEMTTRMTTTMMTMTRTATTAAADHGILEGQTTTTDGRG